MSHIIAISGKLGSGKDTLADMLVENYGFVKMSFAENLKRACQVVFGFTEDQLFGALKTEVDHYWSEVLEREVTPAIIFQEFGTDVMREGFCRDIWIHSFRRSVLNNAGKNIVIFDMRFENEGVFSSEDLGALMVRVEATEENRMKRREGDKRDPNHPSETGLDDWGMWDIVVENNSTLEDLAYASEAIMQHLYNESA